MPRSKSSLNVWVFLVQSVLGTKLVPENGYPENPILKLDTYWMKEGA